MLKSPLLNFKDLTCVPVGYTTVLICANIQQFFGLDKINWKKCVI